MSTVVRFPVSQAKAAALYEKMSALGIQEEDLEESFVRSGGKGGQNVNKVETCVVLVHKPSGMAVKCQQERSQGLNRFWARRMLLDKIEAQILGKASKEQARIEKVRRQKRRRSRRAKEKMLAEKRAQSQQKSQRKRVDRDSDS